MFRMEKKRERGKERERERERERENDLKYTLMQVEINTKLV